MFVTSNSRLTEWGPDTLSVQIVSVVVCACIKTWAWPERAGLNSRGIVPSQTLPVGAVGAVVYSGLAGGELQQFIPLLLPLLLRVHQAGLRRKEGRTHTRLPFREGVSNVTKACADVMASHHKVTRWQLRLYFVFTQHQHHPHQFHAQKETR